MNHCQIKSLKQFKLHTYCFKNKQQNNIRIELQATTLVSKLNSLYIACVTVCEIISFWQKKNMICYLFY